MSHAHIQDIKTKRLVRLEMKRIESTMKRGQSTVTQGQLTSPSILSRMLIVRTVTVSFTMYQNYSVISQ